MSNPASHARRSNPFARGSQPSSPQTSVPEGRPKSLGFPSSTPSSSPFAHGRNQSFSPLSSVTQSHAQTTRHERSQSNSNSSSLSTTFAPRFIEAEEAQKDTERVRGIEGENDFSGKRYVWLRDPQQAFVKGWVVEEHGNDQLLVQCDDGSQREVASDSVDKVNPTKFDKADDMAELTHLNEASVVHNLHLRYQSDLIYTYSGLFLVTINPYCPLPIYSNDYVRMYKGRSREDTKPHIFAMADLSFRNLVEEGQNQSILVTGESGAGKTENTKKVIQYLAAVANNDAPVSRSGARQFGNLSQQILRANPILESFGNAQTVRNNNSSRFGKFIRIEFHRSGQIAGAYIDWYLLEKSRVVRINSSERNYHIFYQLLGGADRRLREEFLLNDLDTADFEYTRHGNDVIGGVSDQDEWNMLLEAFHVMGFSKQEQSSILRSVAAVLHMGNITVNKQSARGDQASLPEDALQQARKVCKLLGIPFDKFVKGLLHPVVKAGREIVEKVQTPEQVRASIDALAKGIYERAFGDLVSRINRQLDGTSMSTDDSRFIGVLDIAGFEIFEHNSFEQLCINYTNEKLQQFFNHHMFVLEQEEYAREQIEWKFIDFGKDLQPTIDLIELPNPIGIFSCLDEDSVMPKATDKTFTEKLHSLWDRKTAKYRPSRLSQGFILTHYAAEVEYSTDGWLEKNKDPLNDNITQLLAQSTDKHVANLFADCADNDDELGGTRSRVKRGLFRTVAQRHKEQLSTLMNQLHATHPHFVRCILPNHKKRPKQFNALLVLDQLRCNGVLEGIRIARTGFPNRLPFAEFRSRYEVLCKNMPKGYIEGQQASEIILEKLGLDKALYRVGLTKVFFRAGVLAELEEQRDALINDIMLRFQSASRGFTQRRIANKRLYRAEATRIIQQNFHLYLNLTSNPWWRLFVRMRPLLGETRTANEVKKRDEAIQKLQTKIKEEGENRQKIEEDRRRAEGEIQRIQQTLESERALALDKEEIFKRLQEREAELSEKLAGAIEDQEHLEDQLDELIDAKKQADEQARSWQTQLEQAGGIIARLEHEKQDLVDQLAELDERLSSVERSRNEDDEKSETLARDKRMLESQLHLQERKVADLEAKLLKTDQDLDVKFANATKELQSSRTQNKDLLEDNRQIRQQLSELSATSTSYEDVVRRKESEIAVLKSDRHRHETEKRALESERSSVASRLDSLQGRLRQVQADADAMKSQKSQAEREAAETKKLLDAKLSEDQKTGDNRRRLEEQIKSLKDELFQVQANLSRERQSRDDVQMLSEHKLVSLKEEYELLNESKITIEKEMYVQQDGLRRAIEARNSAETGKKQLQAELMNLRDRFARSEDLRLEAEAAAERTIVRQAQERTADLRRELDEVNVQLDEAVADRDRLATEVQNLNDLIADSDNFRSQNDQYKERLEREIVTVKGRLAASENDNRALLNKIQQKNLDIARSNSRAGESSKFRVNQLHSEKTRMEDDLKKTSKQLGDAQMAITSLEKQKEKLELNLEDLSHEVTREHQATRNAEKASSTLSIQLTEANRNLETEKQMKAQAQANTRKTQASLDDANEEVEDCRNQLVLLQKVFDPEIRNASPAPTWEAVKPRLAKSVDIAHQLEAAQMELKVFRERCDKYESQMNDLRLRHQDELTEMDAKHSTSKRHLLEELHQNALPTSPRSNGQARRGVEIKPLSNFSTPDRVYVNRDLHDSGRTDRTSDTAAYNKRMDLAGELEQAQNKVQVLEMQNRQLQGQLGRSSSESSWEDSPSLRRVQKLERENNRLHEKLDDSAKKVSALEKSLRSGELSLRDVQAKSHEELFDLLNSQENSRKSLLNAHNAVVTDLADLKTQFDSFRNTKSRVEVDLRDANSELEELRLTHEHESSNHNQLLQEFADLQIRLDTESSRLNDATSSVNLYKARADEYFSKLEQAEISVVKASRAEQFARAQARETEERCATIMSERKQMDTMLEDLQRQAQRQEEKIEDLSADLESTAQAKKRLQHELEDYRSQRAADVEDRELSLDQMRKKYQSEFSTLTNELEIERDNVLHARSETSRMREELEDLRAKWDDEVLNSSTWAKEKARLEMTQQDLSSSREEAVGALNEAQSRIVSLLSQVRELRTSTDDVSSERDLLVKEKRSLETRLKDMRERYDELSQGQSPALRNAAGVDREVLELKSQLAAKDDVAEAAIGKMRRADALATELQKDIVAERENIDALHRERAGLEKNVKDLQGRVVELESKGFSSASASGDVRFLNGRIKEVGFPFPTFPLPFLPLFLLGTRCADAVCVSSSSHSSKPYNPPLPRPRARSARTTAPSRRCRRKSPAARNPSRASRPSSTPRAPASSASWPTSTSCSRTSRGTNLRPEERRGTSSSSARRNKDWSASSRGGKG